MFLVEVFTEAGRAETDVGTVWTDEGLPWILPLMSQLQVLL